MAGVELSAPEASAIADDLLNKPTTERRTFKLAGSCGRQRPGKPEGASCASSDDGLAPVKASYDIPLTSQVREALSHKVTVRLRETAYFHPFEDKPHKREWELVKINEIGDWAGALAEAEQLQIEGT